MDPRVIERWTGLAAIIVGTGFLAGSVYGFVRYDQIADDPDLTAYRNRFGPDVSDVCVAASEGNPGTGPAGSMPEGVALAGRVDSLCGQSKMLNALRFVLLGFAAAGIGAGTYLMIRSTRELGNEGDVSLIPSLGPTGGSLTAAWRF